MKNKKAIYVLLPLVALIWGLIIYRIISGAGSDDEVMSLPSNMPLQIEKEVLDTFSIYADYADPFLDYSWDYEEGNEEEYPELEEMVVVKPPVIIKWPGITFGGIVKNQKSNKQVVLVTIGGNGYLMKTGDVVSGVTLKKVCADSIQVEFEKEIKNINK